MSLFIYEIMLFFITLISFSTNKNVSYCGTNTSLLQRPTGKTSTQKANVTSSGLHILYVLQVLLQSIMNSLQIMMENLTNLWKHFPAIRTPTPGELP